MVFGMNRWSQILAWVPLLTAGFIGPLDLVAQSPFIFDRLRQPEDRIVTRGSVATLSLSIGGTSPMAFQWWKDGVPLAEATTNRLNLTNVAFADTGNYWLTVTNAFGAVTSRVAQLTVVPAATVRRIGNIPVAGWVDTVAIVGSTVFAGVSVAQKPMQAGLEIWDATDPANPRQLGAYRMPAADSYRGVPDVVVDGNRAYLALGSQGIEVLDVANPTLPVRLGGFPTSNTAIDLVVRGNHLFVATDKGVLIYDRSGALPFPLLGKYDIRTAVYTLALRGNTLFAAAPSIGVQVIDVGDPAAPSLVSKLSFFGPDTVRLWGGRAYVAGSGSPAMFDVHHLQFPVRLGVPKAQPGTDAHGMAVERDLILAGAGQNRLEVFDAGTSAVPFSIGEIRTPTIVEAVESVGGRIYAAVASSGVDIFELGLPSDPPLIMTPVQPVVAVAGTTAELAVEATGGGFLSFQWAKDGQPLSGATNRTLRLPGVSAADEAVYSVVVANALGQVSGGEARLSLIASPPLTLSAVQFGDPRGPKFGVLVPAGVRGELYGSADLQNWQPLWYGTFGERPLELFDGYASNAPARVYRLDYGAR